MHTKKCWNVTANHKYKQVITMLCLMVTLLTILCSIIPTARADDADDLEITSPEDLDMYIKKWQEYRDDIYGEYGSIGGAAWDVASTAKGCNPHFNLTTVAKSIYKFSSYSGKWMVNAAIGGTSTTLIESCVLIYEGVAVIGIALIFLYFLIDLLDEVQADNFTIEKLIKKLITLTVAIVVVNIGGNIFATICDFSDALIDDLSSAVSLGSIKSMDSLHEQLMGLHQDAGFLSQILIWLSAATILIENAIPYAIHYLLFVIVYLLSFSRFVEIVVRFVMAPIGIAQLVSGGAKGPGMRYIKKFASCALQGAVCIVAYGSQQIIQNNANELNSIFVAIILPLTILGFLLKSGKIADDIVGV